VSLGWHCAPSRAGRAVAGPCRPVSGDVVGWGPNRSFGRYSGPSGPSGRAGGATHSPAGACAPDPLGPMMGQVAKVDQVDQVARPAPDAPPGLPNGPAMGRGPSLTGARRS